MTYPIAWGPCLLCFATQTRMNRTVCPTPPHLHSENQRGANDEAAN